MAPPRILVLSSLLWMHVSSPRVFSFHIFQYFHKYSTVKSTLLDFCPIDHFLWILRLVNQNIHWEQVCIEKSEPLHRSLNLFAENWWVVGGLESSSLNGRGLDYIAFYIRFLLRTKTRLFDDWMRDIIFVCPVFWVMESLVSEENIIGIKMAWHPPMLRMMKNS